MHREMRESEMTWQKGQQAELPERVEMRIQPEDWTRQGHNGRMIMQAWSPAPQAAGVRV